MKGSRKKKNKLYCVSNKDLRFCFKGEPIHPLIPRSKKLNAPRIPYWRDLFKKTLPAEPKNIYKSISEKRSYSCRVLPPAGWFTFVKLAHPGPCGFVYAPPVPTLADIVGPIIKTTAPITEKKKKGKS